MTGGLWLFAVQGLLGAFDTIYFPEGRARLPAPGLQSPPQPRVPRGRSPVFAALFGAGARSHGSRGVPLRREGPGRGVRPAERRMAVAKPGGCRARGPALTRRKGNSFRQWHGYRMATRRRAQEVILSPRFLDSLVELNG